MKKFMAWVPNEDYETFLMNYPAYGAKTWFIRECLRRFNELHTDIPDDLIKTVAEGVKEDMS